MLQRGIHHRNPIMITEAENKHDFPTDSALRLSRPSYPMEPDML